MNEAHFACRYAGRHIRVFILASYLSRRAIQLYFDSLDHYLVPSASQFIYYLQVHRCWEEFEMRQSVQTSRSDRLDFPSPSQ